MTTSHAESARDDEIDVASLANPVHLLALGFGAGLAPRAPGTFGSLVGVVVAALLSEHGLFVNVFGAVAISIVGIWICGASARRFGVHDHPAIVWDEIAGMTIALLAAPRGWTWSWAVCAFVLFRIFDILKPWPIREIDHGMRGGVGIMLDDVLAGILAAIVLLLIRYIT
jgi:phosphatidylglycerophosphatase A